MAKPYTEINKTDFRNLYNIDKILIRKDEIMEFLKTYKDDDKQAVAFATRKKHQITLEDVMLEIREIKSELKTINDRLDNIVKKNNLIE